MTDAFWAGDFGTEYTKRNDGGQLLRSRIALFARMLKQTHGIRRVIEFGANSGVNLHAIWHLLPDCTFTGVEINQTAARQLYHTPQTRALQGSVFDLRLDDMGEHDVAMSCGFLIHVPPDRLPEAYHRLHTCSSRYILLSEYYNPSPIQVVYRGHTDRLWKRDFAGEILDTYPDLRLIDYGFRYHRDPNFPADDLTWFLMEKR